MLDSKKGVEPLITTVLVIGMVVAGSVIVFFWGEGFTEELIEKGAGVAISELNCVSDVKIDIIRHDASTLTVENKGKGKIDAFTLIEDGGTPHKEYVEIEPGDIATVDYFGGAKIVVIPELRIAKGVFQPCSGKGQKLTYTI